MNVKYTPPLMEQVKGRQALTAVAVDRPVVVFILASNSFVKCVDPKTRKATADNQQFVLNNGRLTILPRSQWVEHPTTIEVGEARV